MTEAQRLRWALDYDDAIYVYERTRQEIDQARLAARPPVIAGQLADVLSRISYKAGVSGAVFVRAVGLVHRFENLRPAPLTAEEAAVVAAAAFLLAWEVEDVPNRAVARAAAGAVGAVSAPVGKWHDELLRVLDYHICFPTPYTFLQRFAFAAGLDEVGAARARFAVEAAMFGPLVALRASHLAAAAVFVSLAAAGRGWALEIAAFAGAREADLVGTGRELLGAMRDAPPAVARKFAAPSQRCVSELPLPDL